MISPTTPKTPDITCVLVEEPLLPARTYEDIIHWCVRPLPPLSSDCPSPRSHTLEEKIAIMPLRPNLFHFASQAVPSNSSSDSAPLASAEEGPLAPGADEGGAKEYGEMGGSPSPSMPSDSTLLVPTPNGGAPVKISMPKSTAEAIAMNKAIQDASSSFSLDTGVAAVAGDKSGFFSPSAEGEMESPPRTLLVRPSDAHPLKVTVPRTTAEAVAMNRSIQERARLEAAAREGAAAAAMVPPASPTGVEDGPAVAEGDVGGMVKAKAAPKEMVVTPTARSNSLKIPVPATTAEAMAMNKAMRSRFREAAADQSPTPGRLSGWMKSRKRRGGASSGGGKFGGLSVTEDNGALDGSGDRTEGWIVGGAAAERENTRPSWSLGEKSFDRTILELSRNMQWSQIIRVWEVRCQTSSPIIQAIIE